MQSLTCSHYRGFIHHGLTAANKEYWKSRIGITRRISSIAQGFNYAIFNNAVKIIGKSATKKVQFMDWITYGDDNVCPICLENATKGRKGRFRPGWFTPMMPAHGLCRCQWMLWY